MKIEWDDERDAAYVLCELLGASATRRDPGGGPRQVHDLDLHLSNGTTVAIEVTRHTSQAYQKRLGAAEKMDWQFPGLRSDWHVGMLPHYRVKDIHRELPRLVRDLEVLKVESALVDRERKRSASPVWDALWSLGARIVYRLSDAGNDGGFIDLGESPAAGVTATDVAVDVVSLHAGLPDNKLKLEAAADANERHLFIWVEHDQHAVTAAMAGPLPNASPDLGTSIDSAWLATGYHTARVWRHTRETALWTDMGHVVLSS